MQAFRINLKPGVSEEDTVLVRRPVFGGFLADAAKYGLVAWGFTQVYALRYARAELCLFLLTTKHEKKKAMVSLDIFLLCGLVWEHYKQCRNAFLST